MTNETRQRLHDILFSCQAISRYTAGLDLTAYRRDDMVRDAVERRLGIIGEALNRAVILDPEIVDQIPESRSIVGLRNRVIHGYDAVDNEIVWDIVQNKLPQLRRSVEELLNQVEPT